MVDVFRASRIRRTAVRAVPMRSAKAAIDRLSSFILCRIEAVRERLKLMSGEVLLIPFRVVQN